MKIRLIARSLFKPPSPHSTLLILCSVVQGYHPFTKSASFICLPLALHRGFWQCDGDTPGKRDLFLLLPGLHDQAAGGQVRSRQTRKSVGGNVFLFTPSSAEVEGGVYWWCDPAVEVIVWQRKIDGWSCGGVHSYQADWVRVIESAWRKGLRYPLKTNCVSYLEVVQLDSGIVLIALSL